MVASHIKPWSQSLTEEGPHKYNDLLLIANLDKAFDLGFVSFNEKANILTSMFGDSYHESWFDIDGIQEVNGKGYNSGYTAGMTNDRYIPTNHVLGGKPFTLLANVFDGQYATLEGDTLQDQVQSQNGGVPTDVILDPYGTWLARKVISVPEPSSLLVFALALMWLSVSRFRKA